MVAMPDHAQLPPLVTIQGDLATIRHAWSVLASGAIPRPKSVPVRVRQVDPPAPGNLEVMNGRDLIERFVWPYFGLLVKSGSRAKAASRCGMPCVPTFGSSDGATVEAALSAITTAAAFLLGHPVASVAWAFALESSELARNVAWAIPSVQEWVSTGIACRADGCDGVYKVVVTTRDGSARDRKVAFGKSRPVPTCDADPSHMLERLGDL